MGSKGCGPSLASFPGVGVSVPSPEAGGWGVPCFPESQDLVFWIGLAGWQMKGGGLSAQWEDQRPSKAGVEGCAQPGLSRTSGIQPLPPPSFCLGPGQPPLAPGKQTKFFGCLQFSTVAAKISKCLPTHPHGAPYLPPVLLVLQAQGPSLCFIRSEPLVHTEKRDRETPHHPSRILGLSLAHLSPLCRFPCPR